MARWDPQRDILDLGLAAAAIGCAHDVSFVGCVARMAFSGDPHELLVRELVESEAAELSADTGVLDSAEGEFS